MSGDQGSQNTKFLSPDTGLIRDKLQQTQDSLFQKERELNEVVYQLRETQMQLKEESDRAQELRQQLNSYRQQDSYIERVKALIRQAKPSVQDLVNLALAEEKAKVQEKYDQMMDMLAEKEKSLNNSQEILKGLHNPGKNVSEEHSTSQIFDLRNYIVKLEDMLRDKDTQIKELASSSILHGHDIRFPDEMGPLAQSKNALKQKKSQIKLADQRLEEQEVKLNKSYKRAEQTRMIAEEAIRLIENSFKCRSIFT